MSMNARQYTLQELWGGSLEEHPRKAKKRKLKLYCISRDRHYYATNGHSICSIWNGKRGILIIRRG